MKEEENESTNACCPFLVDCCQLSKVSFLHLILTIAWVITTSRWARKLDHSKKEGDSKPCFSDAELACRLAFTGKETALIRGQRRSHSVSAPRFSAIRLDQTGIHWRQRLNFTVPSCMLHLSGSSLIGLSLLIKDVGAKRLELDSQLLSLSFLSSSVIINCFLPIWMHVFNNTYL